MSKHFPLILLLLAILPALSPGQTRPQEEQLWQALRLGDVPEAKAALEAGADPNLPDDRGFTALNYAAASPAVELLSEVIVAGGEYWPDKHTEAPILTAARHGAYKHAMVLAQQGHDLHVRDPENFNALFHVTRRDQEAFANFLLQRGVDQYCRGRGVYSILHHAAKHGATKVLQLLIDRGEIDLEETDPAGNAALQIAAQHGQTEAALLLLKGGAKPDPVNKAGETPLHQAARAGNSQLAALLRDYGAVAIRPNAAGDSPLHLAAAAGHLDAVIALLGPGADPNAPDAKGLPPLHYAAENGHAILARTLIRQGASMEFARLPAVWQAVVLGDMEALRKLVNDKASARQKVLGTPLLCWALRAANPEAAVYLLDRGASELDRDAQGNTTLHLAVQFALQGLAERFAADPQLLAAFDDRYLFASWVALEHNRYRMLPFLLDTELMPLNPTINQGMLQLAIRGEVAAQTLPILAEKGLDPYTVDAEGYSPLRRAAQEGRLEAAKTLIELEAAGKWQVKQGRDWETMLELPDRQGNPPLFAAACNKDFAMTELLLRAGANTLHRNDKGETAWEAASLAWAPETALLIRNWGK